MMMAKGGGMMMAKGGSGSGGWGKDVGKGGGWGNDFGKGDGKGKKSGGWSNQAGEKLWDFKAEQKVWLGNIPESFDRKDLKDHMGQAGNVKLVVVNKGQGGAAYATEEEAQAAIATLNGSIFSGNAIEVDVWTRKEKTSSRVMPESWF